MLQSSHDNNQAYINPHPLNLGIFWGYSPLHCKARPVRWRRRPRRCTSPLESLDGSTDLGRPPSCCCHTPRCRSRRVERSPALKSAALRRCESGSQAHTEADRRHNVSQLITGASGVTPALSSLPPDTAQSAPSTAAEPADTRGSRAAARPRRAAPRSHRLPPWFIAANFNCNCH